jgi:predicted transcriptional regulator
VQNLKAHFKVKVTGLQKAGQVEQDMAVRLNKRHQDSVISCIKSGQLVKRLQDHADGKIDLLPTQIKCAEILLRKTTPDLKAVDLTGNLDVNGSWTVKLS